MSKYCSFNLASEIETVELGILIAKELPDEMVIFLHGELGSGKTTFTRGLLNGLGFSGVVKSPTYTLVEPYSIHDKSIYHFDLYRLPDPEELEYIGIRDYFESSICVIEWPNNGLGIIPKADLEIQFIYRQQQRQAVLTSNTFLGQKIITKLT